MSYEVGSFYVQGTNFSLFSENDYGKTDSSEKEFERLKAALKTVESKLQKFTVKTPKHIVETEKEKQKQIENQLMSLK